MELKRYERRTHYYETDKLGIVHHSNYIRWMEEARVDFLKQIGLSYIDMEERNVSSPLVSSACQYKKAVHFDDVISIGIRVTQYNSVKIMFHYDMINQRTGEICCTGMTEHCFTTGEGRPLILKKAHPQVDAAFREWLEDQENPR